MEKFHYFVVISLMFSIAMISSSAVEATTGVYDLGFFPSMTSSAACDGSIGECMSEGAEEEFAMDSESNRRILAYRRRYISYGALSRNRVPCSRRGASYYNCRPGAQANPYNRGCSAIARCRS